MNKERLLMVLRAPHTSEKATTIADSTPLKCSEMRQRLKLNMLLNLFLM